MPTHRLTVVETDREIEPDLVGSKAARHFFDFVVDGAPLYADLRSRGIDSITPLWLDDDTARVGAIDAARSLLGEAEGDANDRVTIYGCAECGDLTCGALTVRLSLTADTVAWRDWGWQTNYLGEIDRAKFENLPDLEFDRGDYEAAIRGVLVRLSK